MALCNLTTVFHKAFLFSTFNILEGSWKPRNICTVEEKTSSFNRTFRYAKQIDSPDGQSVGREQVEHHVYETSVSSHRSSNLSLSEISCEHKITGTYEKMNDEVAQKPHHDHSDANINTAKILMSEHL